MSMDLAVRERQMVKWSRRARRHRGLVWTAGLMILLYNVIGIVDIVSTGVALELGAREINPFLRWAMETHGTAWITLRLTLQLVVSGLILWYPHRMVLAIFAPVLGLNSWVAMNNMAIAGLL